MRTRRARLIRDAIRTARAQWGTAKVLDLAYIGSGVWADAYRRTRGKPGNRSNDQSAGRTSL